MYCYHFLVFTKEESCDDLYKSLINSKRFNYAHQQLQFYAVHRKQLPCILKVLTVLEISLASIGECDTWWMPKEKAISLSWE